jgi:hypothetical protein
MIIPTISPEGECILMKTIQCKPAGNKVMGQTNGIKVSQSVFPPNSSQKFFTEIIMAHSHNGSQLFAPLNPRADKPDN